jgi:hypothetical protein
MENSATILNIKLKVIILITAKIEIFKEYVVFLKKISVNNKKLKIYTFMLALLSIFISTILKKA